MTEISSSADRFFQEFLHPPDTATDPVTVMLEKLATAKTSQKPRQVLDFRQLPLNIVYATQFRDGYEPNSQQMLEKTAEHFTYFTSPGGYHD